MTYSSDTIESIGKYTEVHIGLLATGLVYGRTKFEGHELQMGSQPLVNVRGQYRQQLVGRAWNRGH